MDAAPRERTKHDLVREAQRGDARARATLIELELLLVRRLAARYRGLGLPNEDLAQEGALGVLDAVAHYDPDRNVEFDSYAGFRAHRAIRNALTERARLLRLPKHIVERRHALARAEAEVLARTGRLPTDAELAERTGLPERAVRDARTVPPEPASLDAPVLPDGTSLEALVSDGVAPTPEERALHDDEIARIDAAVAGLPGRQRLAVEHVFGFDGEAMSLAAVASELGVSPPRARAIVIDALERLRCELDP